MLCVDAGASPSAHDDSCLLLRRGNELDELLRGVVAGRLLADHQIHRLPGKARGNQLHLDLGIHPTLILHADQHVHPDRPHGDLAPIQLVQSIVVSGGHGHRKTLQLLYGNRPTPFGRFVVRACRVLVVLPTLPIHPAGGETGPAHSTFDPVVPELPGIGLDPSHELERVRWVLTRSVQARTTWLWNMGMT
jgi:hypothetical protein